MKRREFITLLGGAVAAWPMAASAQQAAMRPIIGLVSIGASPIDPANFRPFLEQMRELGYVDGQNVVFDRRFAAGDDGLIKGFVADLVRRPVDIIVATGNSGGRRCKAGDLVNPHCHIYHSRSNRYGIRPKSCPPRRQCHRSYHHGRGNLRQAH